MSSNQVCGLIKCLKTLLPDHIPLDRFMLRKIAKLSSLDFDDLRSTQLLELSNQRFKQRALSEVSFKLLASLDEDFVQLRQNRMIERWEHVMQYVMTEMREANENIRCSLDAVDCGSELEDSVIESFQFITFVDDRRAVMTGVDRHDAVRERTDDYDRIPNG